LTILQASQKTQDQDARYIIDRQLIATWLNYQAGNSIQAADLTKTDAKDVISWSVKWLQLRTPDENIPKNNIGDGSLTLNASTLKTPSSSSFWNIGIDGPDAGTGVTGVSPVPMFNAAGDVPAGVKLSNLLDEYNNHGTVYGVPIATPA